jgi:hypothetical protein
MLVVLAVLLSSSSLFQSMDTQEKLGDAKLKEAQRVLFNKKVFGIDKDGKVGGGSPPKFGQ